MKIEINLKIILALIFYFILDNINIYLIFLVFTLIHEIAHLLVGIAIGGIPKRMTISIFGVSLEFYSYGKNKAIHRILFFAIGPIINLIIGFLSSKLILAKEIKEVIVKTNYAIGIFNLLPILPLDGGKILKEFLRKNLLRLLILVKDEEGMRRNSERHWRKRVLSPKIPAVSLILHILIWITIIKK